MKWLSLLVAVAVLFMAHVAAQGGRRGGQKENLGEKLAENLGELGEKFPPLKDLFPKPGSKDRSPPSLKPECPKRSPPPVIESAEFDFIVVGAGTAGAAVAGRLSEQFTVLLLESGPKLIDNPDKHDPILNSILSGSGEIGTILSKLPKVIADKVPWLTVPSGSSLGMHIQETPMMWNFMSMANSSYFYQTVPQLYAQKREISYPRGNVVGGSSASNSMVFFKGTRRNFDEEWRDKHGLEGWGYDDLARYFKKFEHSVHLKGSKKHGSKGPIKTTISGKFLGHPAVRAWHEAALKLGWPELQDANDPENQYGASIEWQQFVSESGRRSDATGYLREAERKGRVCWDKPKNECRPEQTLHIWTEKFATKVIIDEAAKRAIGVEFLSAPEFPYHARTIHPDFPLDADEGLKHQHPFTKWDRSSLEKPSVLGAPVHRDLAMDYENLGEQYIPERAPIPKEKLTRVNAKREVILSAGTIGSAQLLMLSGIGPQDHLLANDIKVLADLPVGRRVQDHQEVVLAWRYPEDYTPLNDLGEEATNGFPNAIAWIEGKISSFGSNQIIGGVEGAPEGPKGSQKIPKWHLHHLINGGMETFDLNLVLDETLLEYPHRIPRSAAEFFGSRLARVHSHVCELSENHAFGTIELRSKDPLLDPFVDPRYGSSHEDNLNLIDCIKQLRTIMAAADPHQTGEEISACKDAQTDEQLLLCIRNMVWGHHISGSAPMGTCHSKTAVTDSHARVHEIDGLRVVDASLFPEIPHGNIAGPVYAVAEKITDLIKEDHGHPVIKDEL